MTKANTPSPLTIKHVQGASVLVIDAIKGITNLVENMHRNIASVSAIVGRTPQGRTKGITGLVYRSVRGVTGVVGWSIDKGLSAVAHPKMAKVVDPVLEPVLRRLAKQLDQRKASGYRETVLAAINGVLGDRLCATGNPLAISMALRQGGQRFIPGQTLPSGEKPKSKLLVMVHGLCMNDLQWMRKGHDHGALLAQSLGYSVVYLHYNTGRAVNDNGQDFAQVLEALVSHWPEKLECLTIVGHSMGGLITRSAAHHALELGLSWPAHLQQLICLGTPHTGSPLERAGRGVDFLLGISPYTAPLAKLGLVRSQGIQDLRHGKILDEVEGARWPQHVKMYVVAATKSAYSSPSSGKPAARMSGDGLVPVDSALGIGKALTHAPFPVPAGRRAIVGKTDHFDLLSNTEAYAQMHLWLIKP